MFANTPNGRQYKPLIEWRERNKWRLMQIQADIEALEKSYTLQPDLSPLIAMMFLGAMILSLFAVLVFLGS